MGAHGIRLLGADDTGKVLMQNVHCDRLPSPACISLRKNLAFVEHVFGTKCAQSVADKGLRGRA
jgi:hypothetical protein